MHNQIIRYISPPNAAFSPEEYRQLLRKKVNDRGHEVHRHLNGVHLVCIHCKQTFPKSGTIYRGTIECLSNFSLSIDRSAVEHQSQSLGPAERFQGSLADFRKVSDSRSKNNNSIRLRNIRNLKQARESYYIKCPWRFTVSQESSVLGVSPAPGLGTQASVYDNTAPWMLNLHESHSLYVAGGLVFCNKCGSIQSVPRKTRLSEECVPLPEYSISNPQQKHGSHSKINQLMKGSLSGAHLSRWPNGAKKQIKLDLPDSLCEPLGFLQGVSIHGSRGMESLGHQSSRGPQGLLIGPLATL